jgi:acetoin utilization protein AcuC
MIIVHDPDYANWIFDPSHPTQGRRFVNGFEQILTLHPDTAVWRPTFPTRDYLETVHDAEYVAEVLDKHMCAEWGGVRPDMSGLARLFVGGTLMAVRAAQGNSDTDQIAIHLPGAKHHAQASTSEGFCVFNDWAIAAATVAKDERIFILDIDAHHGDGVENLTRNMPHVMAASIHDGNIFPGTGQDDDPEHNVFNWPLGRGASDKDLIEAAKEAISYGEAFEPTMVWITCGADGHTTDPLSTLDFSVNAYRNVANAIARHFPGVPIVVGGAGGYQPDTWTPRIWAEFVDALVSTRRRMLLPKIRDAR